MDVINDPDAPLDAKVRLASAALPFQTPRLEPVGQGKKEQKEEAAKAASAGRFATPAAPRLVADNTKG
ncbi:hypothetical protein [Azospirillum sp. TSO5]|uniref:hypothetical protein n=1 Tax=Azospirillum sp. TSO5 TaxID=716760 RepID=UPI0011B1D1F3|nr:hypothetical protein [Azospirillum sp. TSO5]